MSGRRLSVRQGATLACAVAVFLGSPTLADAHPLHTTLAQITYDVSRHAVQVMIRVFVDDFRTAVSRSTHKPVTAEGPMAAAAQAYVASKFGLTDGRGHELQMRHCGMTRRGDLLWVCVEATTGDDIGAVQIRDQLLCDLYSDQVNIVQGDDGKTKRSVLFTRGDKSKRLR